MNLIDINPGRPTIDPTAFSKGEAYENAQNSSCMKS